MPDNRGEISDELWLGLIEKHPICGGLSPEQLERLRARTAGVRSRIFFDAVRGVSDDEQLRRGSRWTSTLKRWEKRWYSHLG